MSSRQEEKEQRRREREEREQAEQSAAKRKRLVQIVGAVVVGAAIVIGVVLALAGGKDENVAGATDLASAAKAADCVVRSFPNEGQAHVEKQLTIKDFKTNPPTSGDHNITPAPDGLYAPGNEPELRNWVHTLEHGRILFQYAKGTPAPRVAQLQQLYNESALGKPAYHSVLMRNNTNMPFAVAAVAWRHYVGCSAFTDKTIPALRAFRELYVDKAPEQIP